MSYLTTQDYAERVYAGVLGKIIGVYLGRPFEQWSHEKIERELGEVTYYVHEKLNAPLIVTDDDISGTFTFFRALAENGNDPNLTPAQIGDWWLNTIIENRTILWWGGFGVSTEHTAYLRLKSGHLAPESGSIGLNGTSVAEEIGAQIFIDGWGLACPDDPERAVDFARRAGSVSHDGEAIYGAQVVAALVAQAFTERDIPTMLTRAQSLIPSDSMIYALISEMLQWVSENGDDWRATLARIHASYPYARFGTNCPMISNHAIILLALLHGGGDFSRSLMIVNTAGYDTDCNSGNVGCILGVRNGLAGLETGLDWRGPVADRLYLPTADGGRAITDALREAYAIMSSAHALAGQPWSAPKGGARFHFSLPGSVQGFVAESVPALSLGNENGSLALRLSGLPAGQMARAATATFTPPEMLHQGGYGMFASPTLYSGQTVIARTEAGADLSGSVQVGLYARVYGKDNELAVLQGPTQTLAPGGTRRLEFTVPDTGGQPVAEVGLSVQSEAAVDGTVFLDWLTWNNTPTVTLRRPDVGNLNLRAWADSADHFWHAEGAYAYRVTQNRGTGLVSQGESCWKNYTVSVPVRTHLATQIGLCAAVQGLRRSMGLILDADKRIRLVRQWDGHQTILGTLAGAWQREQKITLTLTVTEIEIRAQAGDATLTVPNDSHPLTGGIGFLLTEGTAEFGAVTVSPVE